MKIYVINGVNLNLLGIREPELYGKISLSDIESECRLIFPKTDLKFIQKNSEDELVEAVHEAKNSDAIVYNFGAFSHTSIALLDALSLVKILKIEVHISNVYAREGFRQRMLTARSAHGIITGLGKDVYKHAIEVIIQKLKDR